MVSMIHTYSQKIETKPPTKAISAFFLPSLGRMAHSIGTNDSQCAQCRLTGAAMKTSSTPLITLASRRRGRGGPAGAGGAAGEGASADNGALRAKRR